VAEKPPNIVFIVADDLGWNDVSLNGSPQIGTPNIDSLANDGVILNNYYVYSICSPTRATFLTGRHVIHTGMYAAYTYRTKHGYLNTSFSLLPEYLKSCCGYSTHLVGKWHLGLNTKSTLPTSRGFDTSLGYWFGVEDHFRHRIYGAYDFSDQTDVVTQYNNTFSTPIFTDRAIDIIKTHANDENPFFLYLAYQDVHWPLQAPDKFASKFENNTGGSFMRKMVCAMAAHLDEAVGNVTQALKDYGLWDNTLVVFTSDNGGPTNGDELTYSDNYPLRGGKNTLWEGGNRVVGIVRGAGIKKTNYINNEKIYATDWLPSLIRMASGNKWTNYIPESEPPFLLGDGLDVWDTLSTGVKSPRDWILIETHPPGQYLARRFLLIQITAFFVRWLDSTERYHGDSLIVDEWKIVKYVDTANNKIQDGWYVPPGEDANSGSYTVTCGALPPVGNLPHNPVSLSCLSLPPLLMFYFSCRNASSPGACSI
jgi:arylsulfatase B